MMSERRPYQRQAGGATALQAVVEPAPMGWRVKLASVCYRCACLLQRAVSTVGRGVWLGWRELMGREVDGVRGIGSVQGGNRRGKRTLGWRRMPGQPWMLIEEDKRKNEKTKRKRNIEDDIWDLK